MAHMGGCIGTQWGYREFVYRDESRVSVVRIGRVYKFT